MSVPVHSLLRRTYRFARRAFARFRQATGLSAQGALDQVELSRLYGGVAAHRGAGKR